jgi:pimeloyl-ACP methyl ester carboxylesterase
VRSRPRRHADDLRGASRLAVTATTGVTSLVEAMHRTIASGPDLLGRPLAGPARLITGAVYGGIRGVTQLVGATLDATLAGLAPLLGESTPGPQREAVRAALNGVLGDHLVETANPLAIPMALRQRGHALPLEADALRAALGDQRAPTRLVVLIHGSSMNDAQWTRNGHDHGAALARDLGYAAIYAHYNSGRHVSTNGAELADLLERLVTAWPTPVDELAIVGHSMGGLVARSACAVAEGDGQRWRATLRTLICLGTPHHGAALERGGNWLDALLGVTRYSAPFRKLGRIRSAGVTDLRFGYVLDEHWQGQDRFALAADRRTPLPLPADVACFAIAGTTAKVARATLPGDGLVAVTSALGQHDRPELTLAFPADHRRIFFDTGHMALLDRTAVYEQLRAWLAR